MKTQKGNDMPRPMSLAISGLLWRGCHTLTLATAIYLCGVCLFATGGILAQERPAQPVATKSRKLPTQGELTQQSSKDSSNSNAAAAETSQVKIGELDGRSSEMSKRIEEIGSHATQVLNVIGLLVGFISVVVAIGLWQSKQYMDRAVDQYKAEMKSFIQVETDAKLNEIKAAVADQFQRITIKTKEELDFAVYAQKEILRALVQLESDNVDEVIVGCQTISAMQDRAYLASLKRVLTKWSNSENTRALEQISAAYQKLLAVHS